MPTTHRPMGPVARHSDGKGIRLITYFFKGTDKEKGEGGSLTFIEIYEHDIFLYFLLLLFLRSW